VPCALAIAAGREREKNRKLVQTVATAADHRRDMVIRTPRRSKIENLFDTEASAWDNGGHQPVDRQGEP
jgi:hypothetical protein